MADSNLIQLGLPAISVEARQLKALFPPLPVKTDRNDARKIAQVARTGWYKPVHVKSIGSQQAPTLAAARKHVISSAQSQEQRVIRAFFAVLD